jgi:hypothetical protein
MFLLKYKMNVCLPMGQNSMVGIAAMPLAGQPWNTALIPAEA